MDSCFWKSCGKFVVKLNLNMCHLRSGLWTADGADGQLHPPPPMEFSNHALLLVKNSPGLR